MVYYCCSQSSQLLRRQLAPLPKISVSIFVCGEQYNANPQLEIDGFAGSAANFTISWATNNTIFPTATPNKTYCLMISTDTSQIAIEIQIQIDMVPLQVCYSCSSLKPANNLAFNTDLLAVTYELRDNWNNPIAIVDPIPVFAGDEEDSVVVGYLTGDGVSLINVTGKLWLPVSRVTLYVDYFPSAKFYGRIFLFFYYSV